MPNQFHAPPEPGPGLCKQLLKKVAKRRIGKSRRSCVFCLEGFGRGQVVRLLPCGHYFHYHCVKPWFRENSKCAVCRFDVRKYLEEDEA